MSLGKIMVVEKGGTSYVLASYLTQWGYEVIKVNSLLKAIDYSLGPKTDIDLIIVEMPILGQLYFEFPKKFLERTQKMTPIILYTHIHGNENIKRAIQAGYRDYITRPIEPEILRDKINNIIKPSSLLNQDAFQFKIKEDAFCKTPIFLETINEYGAVILTPFHLADGTIIEIESPSLRKVGISNLRLRLVESSVELNEAEGMGKYKRRSKFSFVGISSSDLTKIRKCSINQIKDSAA